MGRFVRSSFVAVCLLFFSPFLRADGAHSFTDRAGSFSDNFIAFTDSDAALVGSDSAFFVSSTLGSDKDHFKGLDDSEDHHGKAWGYNHHHHHDGNGSWNFTDQDNEDTDGDKRNAGSTTGRDPSIAGVPEPSVLVLLFTALAAFLLKSLRRATV